MELWKCSWKFGRTGEWPKILVLWAHVPIGIFRSPKPLLVLLLLDGIVQNVFYFLSDYECSGKKV